jgi:DNA recombination protein RmuC
LDGYLEYGNSADDAGRNAALASHRRSVEAHVKELSAKNYSQYIRQTGRDSLDYVVMFVPNEGAFQLYYQNFREDWHKAFDKGIIISGESNLFAMLKIIENTWVRVNQQKNTEEVMRLASELLDRVGKFANTFDEARKVLSGRVSVVSTARKLEKKGVQVKASFHAALLGESVQDDVEDEVNKRI